MSPDLVPRYGRLPEQPARPGRLLGLVRNQPHQNPGGAVFAEDGYLLAIVEFDDQGLCYDRHQMNAVSTALDALRDENSVILVFVHGWRHIALSGDDNLRAFRRRLKQTAIDAPIGRFWAFSSDGAD
jgi:hypothetical protein